MSSTRLDQSGRAVISALLMALWVTACSDSSDDPAVRSLTISSYNVGLAPNFVPFTSERLPANLELLSEYDGDVICLQEVWQAEHQEAIKDALAEQLPYSYSVPAEQVYSEGAACSEEEVEGFADCARSQCPGLSGSELVACAPAQCGAFLPELSPGCFDGVVAAVGVEDITVDILVELVTQPTGKFAFDGSLGLVLASRYPLENRAFQDFIDDSSTNHRGALFADIRINRQDYLLGCTHTTANLEGAVPYPASGKYGSWEAENAWMQEQVIGFAEARAGNRPIILAGDFNCGLANPATAVTAEWSENCRAWLDAGFLDPAADQLPCSFCNEENSLLLMGGGEGAALIDHIYLKNFAPNTAVRADRVFDDQVPVDALVPPAELGLEQSPMMMHPSDHYAVEIDIAL